jgi:hypothetical protein
VTTSLARLGSTAEDYERIGIRPDQVRSTSSGGSRRWRPSSSDSTEPTCGSPESCESSTGAQTPSSKAKPRFEASRKRREELARRFFDAVMNGDATSLVDLLADDVVVYADGGGKGPAFPRPVHGRERAARLLLAPTARGERLGERLGVIGMRAVSINGQPGALFLDREGRPIAAVTVDVADDLVQTVRAISNPEKLRHLGTFSGPSGPNP